MYLWWCRSTYAADTAASQLEHAKRRQDLLLVALQDRREALEAAMSDIDAQVAARVAAAEAARAMLSATQVCAFFPLSPRTIHV